MQEGSFVFNLKECSVNAMDLLAIILFKVSIYLNLKIQGAFFVGRVVYVLQTYVTARSFVVSQGWCTFE